MHAFNSNLDSFFCTDTSFLIAWMGYALVCFLRLIGFQVSPMAVAAAMLLAKMSGVLNAIVFVFMNVQVS